MVKGFEMDCRQHALYRLMSEISEECYCAGWMTGNEYTLWQMVSDPNAPRHYGMGEVTDEAIEHLRTMSNEVGGWIRWHDDTDDPNLPAREWGPRFEVMSDWQRRYDRRMAEWEKLREHFASPSPSSPRPE